MKRETRSWLFRRTGSYPLTALLKPRQVHIAGRRHQEFLGIYLSECTQQLQPWNSANLALCRGLDS